MGQDHKHLLVSSSFKQYVLKSENVALSRRMSFKAGPGASGPQAAPFEASSKFSGNEMVMEKLSSFRAKLAKEEKLYGSLDGKTMTILSLLINFY